ncbi:MAG: CYTH domain-containing protein [Bacteroidota bacterium]
MALEIERKFLVISNAFKKETFSSTRIVQGFLNTNPERTVRIRLQGNSAFLTVKGKSSDDGLSRFEWETEISKKEGEDLIKLCEPGIIDKIRYEVKSGTHIIEVDEFHGDNKGLTVAEIELTTKGEAFESPEWLGMEVTGDQRYYNSQLSKNPFKNWNYE